MVGIPTQEIPMRCFFHVPIVAAVLLATGCANYPPMAGNPPATTVSTNSPSLVYGRVASIEYVPPGTQT